MDAISRRGALKAALLTVVALVSPRSWAKKEKQPIAESHPSAKALGYAHKAEKADKSKGMVKDNIAQGQNCSKCLFFTATGDGKWGDCKLLTQGLVSAEGLCMSFTKKS